MIKEMFHNKKEEDNIELGFGTKNYTSRLRFLNRDGSMNIRRDSGNFLARNDIYHWLITISWIKFFLLVIGSYIVTNTLFAILYYSIGTDKFGGLSVQSASDKFMQLFFFSAQTLTTVGYGHIFPIGSLTGSIAAMESMLGLLGFAIATGVLYGRFSKPRAFIEYSNKGVIAPYRDTTAFMFRLANRKQNELIEIECQMVLAITNKETQKRDFHFMSLERHRINFLPLSWTVVHPIDEASPMANLTAKDLEENDAEIIILVKAINDTYSQSVYSRMSYKPDEIEWDSRFVPVNTRPGAKGTLHIDVSEIHQIVKI